MFTAVFVSRLLFSVYLVSPILLVMAMIIVALGLIVGRIESWDRYDSIYWAFITALTVGYGDIRPLARKSKALSILIAGIGIVTTGLIVAVAVQTAAMSFKMHVEPDLPKEVVEEVKQ